MEITVYEDRNFHFHAERRPPPTAAGAAWCGEGSANQDPTKITWDRIREIAETKTDLNANDVDAAWSSPVPLSVDGHLSNRAPVEEASSARW